MLLDELIEAFEEKALVAIAGAARQRMEEAKEAKAGGQAEWWKVGRPKTIRARPKYEIAVKGTY